MAQIPDFLGLTGRVISAGSDQAVTPIGPRYTDVTPEFVSCIPLRGMGIEKHPASSSTRRTVARHHGSSASTEDTSQSCQDHRLNPGTGRADVLSRKRQCAPTVFSSTRLVTRNGALLREAARVLLYALVGPKGQPAHEDFPGTINRLSGCRRFLRHGLPAGFGSLTVYPWRGARLICYPNPLFLTGCGECVKRPDVSALLRLFAGGVGSAYRPNQISAVSCRSCRSKA